MKYIFGFFAFLLFLYLTQNALAQSYSIDGSVVPNTALSSDKLPPPTPPKTSIRGQFTGDNYKIQVGFEDANKEIPYFLSTSQDLIDYGVLLPTDPIIRTSKVSITEPYSQGYTLQAFEDHPLKQTTSEAIIPDTTCDNGICTDTISQPWNGTLSYGFGYRCDRLNASNYCLSDFSDTDSFKQFAKEVSPQVVTQGTKDSASQITYKVNISGAQATQFYTNQINYMLIPNF